MLVTCESRLVHERVGRLPAVVDTAELAGVQARLAWEASGDFPELTVGISTKPTIGRRSGLMFPLTNDRCLLLAEAVRAAGERLLGPEVRVEELLGAPPALSKRKDERYFFVVFERG